MDEISLKIAQLTLAAARARLESQAPPEPQGRTIVARLPDRSKTEVLGGPRGRTTARPPRPNTETSQDSQAQLSPMAAIYPTGASKRKLIELEKLGVWPPPLTKRPRHEGMVVIRIPRAPPSSRIVATLRPKQKRSILERMPNEILAEIYLISHNTALLDTCRTLRNALATDVLFKQLTLAAFDRSDLCERHQDRAEHHKHCTFCQKAIEAGSRDVPAKPHDPAYDEYGEFRVCGLNDSPPCYNWRKEYTGYVPGPRKSECVMPIREKRNLQSQILRSRYFQYHYLEAVEMACTKNKECEREFSRAYNSMVQFIGVDPVPEFDFVAVWTQNHHRHHLRHGVTFPRQLLLGLSTAEDDRILEKLLDWTNYNIWTSLGCARDRNKIFSVFEIGIKRALAANHLVSLSLLLRLTIFGTTATPVAPQGWGISIRMIRDAYALNASTAAIRMLLHFLNFQTCNEGGQFREAYRVVMDQAEKKKDEGEWEAWIYEVLKAKKITRTKWKGWAEWGPSFKESVHLAKTDPTAYLRSYMGKFVASSCNAIIQMLNGATLRQSVHMTPFIMGVGRLTSHGRLRMAAEENAAT